MQWSCYTASSTTDLKEPRYLHNVDTPDPSPQALLRSDLQYETGISQKKVMFLYPEEQLGIPP